MLASEQQRSETINFMRVYFSVILMCLSIFALASPLPDKQDLIRARIEQLRQALLTRKSPDALLSPLLGEQARVTESCKIMRSYIALQFDYSLADLRWKGEDAAELPLRVQWKTAKVDGSLSGTAQFVQVGNDWYFRSFAFLLFPWEEVILATLLAIAFTVAVFAIYRRWGKRGKAVPARV